MRKGFDAIGYPLGAVVRLRSHESCEQMVQIDEIDGNRMVLSFVKDASTNPRQTAEWWQAACAAMQGMAANSSIVGTAEEAAQWAAQYADALLAERNNETGDE